MRTNKWRFEGESMHNVAKIIKQHRIANGLTLKGLAAASGVSQSHLGRIERGERFPSAFVLRKFAKPLGFDEGELFTLAGFLSPVSGEEEKRVPAETILGLDPYVAQTLAQEPVHVQRAVLGILPAFFRPSCF